MSIFASTPPHNTESLPHINYHGNRQAEPTGSGFCTECVTEYKPRPWFDEPRAHEQNPLLAMFRKSPRNASDFLWIIGSTASTEATYGVEESRHARRVLARLAGVTS